MVRAMEVNVTFGIVVGMVGNFGIVGSAGRGVVGNDGNATFGRVGIAGIGGNATLGNDGIVGSVGAEICSKWRAAKFTSMIDSDKATIKLIKKCLTVAIFCRSGSLGLSKVIFEPVFLKSVLEIW